MTTTTGHQARDHTMLPTTITWQQGHTAHKLNCMVLRDIEPADGGKCMHADIQAELPGLKAQLCSAPSAADNVAGGMLKLVASP